MDAERKWKDSDDYVYAWPPRNDSFFDAFHALYEDLCVKVSLTCPSCLAKGVKKGEAVDDLLHIARRIVDIFESNQGKILNYGNPPSGRYSEEAFSIYNNCKYVVSILEYEDPPEDESIRQELLHFYFSDEFLKPLYDKVFMLFPESDPSVSGNKVGRLVSYKSFQAVVNLIETVYVNEWEEKDLSMVVLKPFRGYGMLMYALTVLLSGKRSLDCEDNPVNLYRNTENGPVEVDSDEFGRVVGDFMEPVKEYWTSSFLKRLDWSDGYTVVDNLWKTAYYDRDQLEMVLSRSEVSSDENSLLSHFVHRMVFEGICSPDNIDSVVASVPGNLSADDYLMLNREYASDMLDPEERIKRIKDLYHLFCRETDYLYKNIDQLSVVFKTKFEGECIRWDSECHLSQERESNGALRRMLSEEGTGGVDMTAVYKRLMDGGAYADIPLLDQRSISFEAMHQYIKNCILQDESYKQALLQKLNELSVQVTVPPTDLGEVQKLNALKHLRDHKDRLIDSDNVFNARKMHATLCELVKGEYVKPVGGWTEGIERVKERLSANTKDGKGNIGSWLLKDLETFRVKCFSEFVNEIDWTQFGGIFGKKKKDGIERLTANGLKETFYSNPRTTRGYEVDIIARIIEKYEFRK